jgi:hypothetical protein
MKQETTPNPACERASLKVLRLVEKVVPRGNGAPVRLSYWQQGTKKPGAATKIRFPVYDAKDGNVFNWIIEASEDFRNIRRRERYLEFEKATAKLKGLDSPKVED